MVKELIGLKMWSCPITYLNFIPQINIKADEWKSALSNPHYRTSHSVKRLCKNIQVIIIVFRKHTVLCCDGK